MTIKEVIIQIEKLPKMKDLNPTLFADENGLADNVALGLTDLKPTQFRKIYHTLKAVQRSVARESKESEFQRSMIVTLLPELAYANGRGLIPNDFYQLMRTCLSPTRIMTNDDFIRTVEFLEAILAYHRFHNPK